MAIITGGITSTYIRNFEREFKRAYGEKVAALQTFIDFRSGRVGEDDRFVQFPIYRRQCHLS